MKAFEELKPVVEQLYRAADAVAPMPVSFEFIWEMLAEAHRAELAQAVREAKQDVYLDIQAWCRLGTTNKQFIRNAVERRLAALTHDTNPKGSQQADKYESAIIQATEAANREQKAMLDEYRSQQQNDQPANQACPTCGSKSGRRRLPSNSIGRVGLCPDSFHGTGKGTITREEVRGEEI